MAILMLYLTQSSLPFWQRGKFCLNLEPLLEGCADHMLVAVSFAWNSFMIRTPLYKGCKSSFLVGLMSVIRLQVDECPSRLRCIREQKLYRADGSAVESIYLYFSLSKLVEFDMIEFSEPSNGRLIYRRAFPHIMRKPTLPQLLKLPHSTPSDYSVSEAQQRSVAPKWNKCHTVAECDCTRIKYQAVCAAAAPISHHHQLLLARIPIACPGLHLSEIKPRSGGEQSTPLYNVPAWLLYGCYLHF
jgi:hypothetical protein